MKRILAFGSLALLLVACGGSTFDSGGDASTDDGGTTDGGGGKDGAPVDGAPDTSGPYPCGEAMCSSGDVCVHPCCGGIQIACEPGDGTDGGTVTCPPGSTFDQTCPKEAPCKPEPCKPPPPYCAAPDQCGMLQGRDCYLVCG